MPTTQSLSAYILDPRKVPSKELGGPVPKGTPPGHRPGPRLRGQHLARLEVWRPGPPPEGAMQGRMTHK
jgi:hypothetical protein